MSTEVNCLTELDRKSRQKSTVLRAFFQNYGYHNYMRCAAKGLAAARRAPIMAGAAGRIPAFPAVLGSRCRCSPPYAPWSAVGWRSGSARRGVRKVNAIAEHVVGPLARAAAAVPSGGNDSAGGEGDLLVNTVRLVVRAGELELGHDIAAASICFVGNSEPRLRGHALDCKANRPD